MSHTSCPFQAQDGCPFISTRADLQLHLAYCNRTHEKLASLEARLTSKSEYISEVKQKHTKIVATMETTIAQQIQTIAEHPKTKVVPLRIDGDLRKQGTYQAKNNHRLAISRNADGDGNRIRIRRGNTPDPEDAPSGALTARSPNKRICGTSPPILRGSKRSRPSAPTEEEEDELESETESFAQNSWIAFQDSGGSRRTKRDRRSA
jgi:hypothetical protein